MKFKDEDFGKPISKELSDLLKEFTTKNDVADASTETGVSISTIRDVSRRSNMLTPGNSVAIIELIKIAHKNCENKIGRANIGKAYIEKLKK